MVSAGKWYALPPHTPADVVEVYRMAQDRAMLDPDFDEMTKKQYSEVYAVTTGDETAHMAEQLAVISDDVLAYIQALKQKVGIPFVGTGLLKMEQTNLTSVKDGGAAIVFKFDDKEQTAKVGSRTRIAIGNLAGKRDALRTGMSARSCSSAMARKHARFAARPDFPQYWIVQTC